MSSGGRRCPCTKIARMKLEEWFPAETLHGLITKAGDEIVDRNL